MEALSQKIIILNESGGYEMIKNPEYCSYIHLQFYGESFYPELSRNI